MRQAPVGGTAQQIAGFVDPSGWQRLSAGDGEKGALHQDWDYCELADLDGGCRWDTNQTKMISLAVSVGLPARKVTTLAPPIPVPSASYHNAFVFVSM